MMSQKTVTKQLLINHIDLPYDMQTIIKDYVFLDTASYNNKCKKTIVINEIKNAIVSSLRNIYYPATETEPETGVEDDTEMEFDDTEMEFDDGWNEEAIMAPMWPQIAYNNNMWSFCANENAGQFQASFCGSCGNYFANLNHNYLLLIEQGLEDIPYPQSSLCNCT